MQLQLFRNATLKLRYAGMTILVDPDFGERFSRRSFTGRSQNPMVPLPSPVEEIVAGIDLIIVSHLHADHFDDVARAILPKDVPLICQPGNELAIRPSGFGSVTPLDAPLHLGAMVITPQPAQHGTGAVVETMGPVMGFTLAAAGEPTLYWCGDSVLYPPLATAVAAADPDVIVTHSGGALWDGTLIIMDAEQTVDLARTTPGATVVATHLEALDHCTVSRKALRDRAAEAGIGPDRLRIPQDGEVVEIG